MINLNKIVSIIESYKQYFPEHWEDLLIVITSIR